MRTLNLNKKNMTKLLFALVALSVALPAVPAFAQPERDRGRQEQRQQFERREPERREHERFEHDRREHGDYRFAYREPYVAPYCYTQGGYWTWDGWQQVWVPPQTVCQ